MYSINDDMKKIFVEKLLKWHQKNFREFPWRKTSNVYHILVAEIMLQKTDAKKVEKVYSTFINKYPTPDILSKANVNEVEKEISLLGLHNRSKRLIKIAKEITENFGGQVPKKKDELLHLYGVGDYIANAVLCFGYNEDVPLLDTNVLRVIERVFSIKTAKARGRNDNHLWETVSALIPQGKGRNFNLAILDFSAKVCKARNPLHEKCPMKDFCIHYKIINQLYS